VIAATGLFGLLVLVPVLPVAAPFLPLLLAGGLQ
jgi:hypothetical protein